MDALEAMRTRRSVREFEPKEVSVELLLRAVEAATWAPTGGNRQPWRFIVVTDKERIRTFDPVYQQPWVVQAPAVIVVCANPHDTWSKYDEEDNCWLLDASAATENLLLALHALGLGAVWILSFSKREVRKQLDIPLHWQIVSIVPVGYPAGAAVADQRDRRRPLGEVVFVGSANSPLASASQTRL